MLFGSLIIKEAAGATYDPEEGLKFKADNMFPALPIVDAYFKNDTFQEMGPDQFMIKAHGSGAPRIFTNPIVNTWSGADGSNDPKLTFTDGLLSDRLSDDQGNVHADLINQHKDKIKKVLSFACNGAGTATPETYEKMMGHELQNVSMAPPGKLAYGTSPLSNYYTKLLSYISPYNISEIRNYEKHNGNWEDSGIYKTKLDKGIDVAAPVAAGAGALYGGYKLMPKKNK